MTFYALWYPRTKKGRKGTRGKKVRDRETSRQRDKASASPFERKKATVKKTIAFVRTKGLEPPRLSASDPKSDVATNYTMSARIILHFP